MVRYFSFFFIFSCFFFSLFLVINDRKENNPDNYFSIERTVTSSEFSSDKFVFSSPETKVSSKLIKENFSLINFIVENYELGSKDAEEIVELVIQASEKYNIPKEILFGIIHVESTFQQYAKSEFGAMGLMQIVPKYHKKMIKDEFGASVSDLFVPEINIFAGAKIFSENFKKTKNISKSLKLYNGNLSEESNYDLKVLNVAKKFENIKK